jgi:hypothetical protein
MLASDRFAPTVKDRQNADVARDNPALDNDNSHSLHSYQPPIIFRLALLSVIYLSLAAVLNHTSISIVF